MRSFDAIIKNPLSIGSMIVRKFCCNILSDSLYLRILYFFENRKSLNLKKPRRFTEKIQWLKLHERNPLHTQMVDKIEVKNIVGNIIGKEYIIPTIAIWEDSKHIDFSVLPDQFVLKSTNGSGGSVVICKDKSTLNKEKALDLIDTTCKGNVGVTYREWPYLNIHPRIFAETLITDNSSDDLVDYKFFCFNGKALYCQVIANRRTRETIDFYNQDWEHQDFYGLVSDNTLKQSGKILPKPINYDLMVILAEKISAGHTFLRVDLYNIQGKIYFGETTFFPASGFGKFAPDDWDMWLGDLIELPIDD